MSRDPYKFLSPYDVTDEKYFFGRDREIRTLLDDVLVSRLVVLFAKTGSGKTSLINAGVRPALERREYRTFVVRVSQDPSRSARQKFAADPDVPPLPRRRFGYQLGWLTRRLDRPIVVFLDQFEEFFVYLMQSSPERAHRFIEDIAEARHNPHVHIVFSMREEFFVEMDAFRDEIPTIFHNESNLRLRWFEPDQARLAVVEPALASGASVDDELPERIIGDLAEANRVEPARLQIVCHTLWREAKGKAMRIDDYERLGGAAKIVAQRLEEDVRTLNEDQLRLFERLVPELRTEFGTKYLRGVEELAERLEAPHSRLDELLTRLQNAHLISESAINRARYVEWASDYLAERTEYLRARARATLYTRVLNGAMQAAGAKGGKQDDPSRASLAWGEAVGDAEGIPGPDFDGLTALLPQLDGLSREETAFGLGTALARDAHKRRWFDEATHRGVDAWGVLQHALREHSLNAPAGHVIFLLAELGESAKATELLEEALADPELVDTVFDALARVRTEAAVRVLERMVEDEASGGRAIDSLRRIRLLPAVAALGRTMRHGGAAGARAGVALKTLADSDRTKAKLQPGARELAKAARKELAGVRGPQAEALFVASLEFSLQAAFWFDQARKRGVDVWRILRTCVEDPGVKLERAAGAVELLRELPSKQAEALLQRAVEQSRLREAAQSALEARGPARARGAARAEPPRAEPPRPSPRLRGGDLRREWEVLVGSIRSGRCTPIVGHGVDGGIVPLPAEIARDWARSYEYPLDDPPDLSRVAQYVAATYDPMFPHELLAQKISETSTRGAAERGEAHDVLARLPLPRYVTTRFDDLLSHALRRAGKSPRTEIVRWSDKAGAATGSRLDLEPTPEAPLVIHLFGHHSFPESLVLTEDDRIDFLTSLSALGDGPLGVELRRTFTMGTLLFVGLSVRGWDFQVVNRGILGQAEHSLRRQSLAVQLVGDRATTAYYERLLSSMGIRVYWGSANEFAEELRERYSLATV